MTDLPNNASVQNASLCPDNSHEAHGSTTTRSDIERPAPVNGPVDTFNSFSRGLNGYLDWYENIYLPKREAEALRDTPPEGDQTSHRVGSEVSTWKMKQRSELKGLLLDAKKIRRARIDERRRQEDERRRQEDEEEYKWEVEAKQKLEIMIKMEERKLEAQCGQSD